MLKKIFKRKYILILVIVAILGFIFIKSKSNKTEFNILLLGENSHDWNKNVSIAFPTNCFLYSIGLSLTPLYPWTYCKLFSLFSLNVKL